MGVRDYIRAVMKETPSNTDLNVLASNVLLTIPRVEMPLIIHEMMVNSIRNERVSHGSNLALALEAPGATEARLAGKSWRDRLAPHRAWLNKSRSVNGTLWRLGDMTADQLRESATSKRTNAATLLDNAANDEKIAAALDEHAVAKVDELPDLVVLALFEEVGA